MNFKQLQTLKNAVVIISVVLLAIAALLMQSLRAILPFLPAIILLYCSMSLWGNVILVNVYNEIFRSGKEYIGVLTGGRTPLFIAGGINILQKYKPFISVPSLSAQFDNPNFVFDVIGGMDEPPRDSEPYRDLYVKHSATYPAQVIICGDEQRRETLFHLYLWSAIYAGLTVAMLVVLFV